MSQKKIDDKLRRKADVKKMLDRAKKIVGIVLIVKEISNIKYWFLANVDEERFENLEEFAWIINEYVDLQNPNRSTKNKKTTSIYAKKW